MDGPWREDPSSTHMHMLIQTQTPSPEPDETCHIFALERAFCSDFTCCGLRLHDLHALLDHFETAHAAAPAAYPCPDPALASPAVYPSPGSPYPSPNTNTIAYPSATSEVYTHPPRHLTPYAPPSPPPSASASAPPSPAQPPALVLAHPQPRRELGYQSAPQPSGIDPASVSAGPVRRVRVRGTRGGAVNPCGNGIGKTGGGGGRGSARGRDKAYRCPRAGCSKTYLNPNGLKYHLEKGTCTGGAVAVREGEGVGLVLEKDGMREEVGAAHADQASAEGGADAEDVR